MGSNTTEYNITETFLDPLGPETILDICKAPLHDNEGNVTGILISFEDITERKHAEDAITNSEKRYSGLLNNLDIGIVVHAPDSTIILSNPRVSELLGLSEDQLKGKLAFDTAFRFVTDNNIPMPISEYPVNRIIASKKLISTHIAGIYQPDKKRLH